MELPFSILFQNNHYIIINKPAGMPVYNSGSKDHHRGRQISTLPSVEDFFPLLSKRKDGPWLVHRLDQDTAGCLLIALRKQALIQAQTWFNQKQVTKRYWAIIEGKPEQNEGIITVPLTKQSLKNQWKMVPDRKGQEAVTEWRILDSNQDYSCIELHLLTGRTHQARAHCAILGHPILGDVRYGSRYGNTRLQLLSRFIQMQPDPTLTATAPPPPHMMDFLKNLSVIVE